MALAYVNDTTPGIYTLNRNWTAYTIEQAGANASFTLWDESTVRRLIVEQPQLMPNYPKAQAVRRGIDLAYSKRQIGSAVTSGILQGHSVGQIAAEVQRHVTDMSWTSAVRAARTAVTAAQNGGRQDTYEAAQKMGIELKKEWVATLDNRTRHAHAMADGQVVAVDKPFKLDGYDLMFPGDKSAPGYLVYNCRCTTIAAFKDYGKDGLRRTEDGLIPDMTYEQWEASKRGYNGKQLSPYHDGNKAGVKDVTDKYLKEARPRMGKTRYENGYKLGRHKNEVEAANEISNLFGGKIVLLKEVNAQGVKTPDYLWRGKYWELKNISTAKAADSGLRGALKQIAANPGGVIFRCTDQIDVDALIEQIDDRAFRKIDFNFDVIALRNGELLFARRYKK